MSKWSFACILWMFDSNLCFAKAPAASLRASSLPQTAKSWHWYANIGDRLFSSRAYLKYVLYFLIIDFC
jgi:hypothetical protein